jgi:hypothetical protein
MDDEFSIDKTDDPRAFEFLDIYHLLHAIMFTHWLESIVNYEFGRSLNVDQLRGMCEPYLLQMETDLANDQLKLFSHPELLASIVESVELLRSANDLDDFLEAVDHLRSTAGRLMTAVFDEANVVLGDWGGRFFYLLIMTMYGEASRLPEHWLGDIYFWYSAKTKNESPILDEQSQMLTWGKKKPCWLSPRRFLFLKTLLDRKGTLVPRDELERIIGIESGIDCESLKTLKYRLCEKLREREVGYWRLAAAIQCKDGEYGLFLNS